MLEGQICVVVGPHLRVQHAKRNDGGASHGEVEVEMEKNSNWPPASAPRPRIRPNSRRAIDQNGASSFFFFFYESIHPKQRMNVLLSNDSWSGTGWGYNYLFTVTDADSSQTMNHTQTELHSNDSSSSRLGWESSRRIFLIGSRIKLNQIESNRSPFSERYKECRSLN